MSAQFLTDAVTILLIAWIVRLEPGFQSIRDFDAEVKNTGILCVYPVSGYDRAK